MGTEFDPAFIQAPEHRPKPTILEAQGIPLIDLSTGPIDDLAKEIGDACRKWGFFQVINHGVSPESRRKIESAAREFFARPQEEKMRVKRDEVRVLGYYDTEHTKNVRDWKEVFDFVVEDPTFVPATIDPDDQKVTTWHNQWPDQNPHVLREACEEYGREVEKLSIKLMELIAISLGLEANRFNDFFKDQTSFIRLNHYPPCPNPHLALGVGRHKDAGALTILAQDDVGGLEVKRKSDGEWIRVKPTPHAFIINVGDIIQVWSNERYESVEHRVMVNSERERFSIPFFLNPAHYTMVKPLEEMTDDQNPPKYKAYNWGKFFTTRKGSNFRKLDVENIQIYHFKNKNAHPIVVKTKKNRMDQLDSSYKREVSSRPRKQSIYYLFDDNFTVFNLPFAGVEQARPPREDEVAVRGDIKVQEIEDQELSPVIWFIFWRILVVSHLLKRLDHCVVCWIEEEGYGKPIPFRIHYRSVLWTLISFIAPNLHIN
uniref:Fe2OG dioxygenase domain-containing protein n=1 Tax=Cannabis sativa TaxID=3483 RepID=A0A803QDA1_CANSA